MTRFACFALHDHAPRIVPARAQRRWMDDFPNREIYRCMPMTIANAFGWDILCPVPLEIRWNGGPSATDLSVRAQKPLPGGGPVDYLCRSAFSQGIVTLFVDYIVRTDPGWNLMVGGPANVSKDNAVPLSGIVDTDQLCYPFTMNWRFSRPGTLRFEEDEPFCSIHPVDVRSVAACSPEMRRITDAPDIARRYQELRTAREARERGEAMVTKPRAP